MLEAMPQRLYEEWWRYYRQEPWGLGQTQLAMVLSALTGKKIYEFGAIKQHQKILTEAEYREIFMRERTKALGNQEDH
jgi:hypothetical protein